MNVVVSSRQSRRMSSMLSSSWSRRWDARAKETPAALKFAATYPAPRPSSNRPPESRSIVAAALAVRTGFRRPLSTTRVPTRIRSVTPATAASAAIGSHCGTTRWSVNVILEKPSASYRRTRARQSPSGSQKCNPNRNVTAMARPFDHVLRDLLRTHPAPWR